MVNWLWSKVWGGWLNPGEKVVKVTGWRSAWITDKWKRKRHITVCWWIFE